MAVANPAAATGADGGICVFGGCATRIDHGATRLAEVYDAAAHAWRALPPLPMPTCGAGAALASGGNLMVIGGANDRGFLRRVDVYDPATNSWSRGPSLPFPRYIGDAARLSGGRVYALGGLDQNACTTNSALELDTRGLGPAAALPASPC